ncbi:MAG TPA: hypothetical protein VG841_00340 [Caulobacterales bacterium]|nr:hypothetical protein [Caulobacterales bacterium]
MPTMSKALFAALAAAALVATASPSEARGRHVHATAHTGHGAYTGDANVNRSRGQRHRDATVTGPRGRQTSVTDDRAWNLQEGAYSRDHERTFPNGDTRALQTEASRTAPGEWTVDRSVTGRNGETRTQTGEIQVTH